jgi:SnoaL-like domain
MAPRKNAFSLLLEAILPCCSTRRNLLALAVAAATFAVAVMPASAQQMNAAQFERLMQTLADGWNEGNAQKAAGCFTDDAVYSEPPDKQLYRGRSALFKFFGGTEGRKRAMKMTWHHLIFDESRQLGAGEFTFEYGGKVHGVAMVKIQNGKIRNWREYWYESPLDWKEFTRTNPF